MNSRSLLVPAGTFLLAILLSLAISPAPRLSARAVQEMTGASCETFLEILGKESYLPRGDESGDERKPGNSFVARIKWEPVGGHDPEKRRRFVVRLEGPPTLKGSCDNQGKESLPDYILEAGDNPIWVIVDGVPEYAGDQNRAAVTRDEYGPGEWVNIVVRSYDFGAWTYVVGSAVGCPEKKDRMPKDSDEETLPDLWELGKRFYDDAGNSLEYSIGAKATYAGEDDAESDRDGGFVPPGRRNNTLPVEPAKVHDEPGDGFTAFEEYRGVFVQGKHYRMNELTNDGGPEVASSHRGTAMKNIFILDPHKWVNDRGVVLREHGVQFHRIKREEMSVETYEGQPAAGFMDDNSAAKSQRAIELVSRVIAEFGNSMGFSINREPLPIVINDGFIRYEANDVQYILRIVGDGRDPNNVRWGRMDFDEMLHYTLAHEIGHKLNLRHNEQAISDAGMPVLAYNNLIYWNEVPGMVTWSVMEILKRKFAFPKPNGSLEFKALETLTQGPLGTTIPVLDPTLFFEGHDGLQHYPMLRQYPFNANGFQLYWHHTGTLMDARPEYRWPKQKLPADQRKKILLK